MKNTEGKMVHYVLYNFLLFERLLFGVNVIIESLSKTNEIIQELVEEVLKWN